MKCYGLAEIAFRERGTTTEKRLHAHRIINCTGSESDCRRIDDSRVGLARPDPLFLGVDVNENGALIEYRSRPSRLLLPLDQRVKAVFGKPPLCLRFGSRPSNWPYTWPKPCALKNDPMICWKLPPVDTQAREVAAPGSGLSSSADRRSSLMPTWLAAPDSVTL
jgi:hypothetical protein